MITVYSFQKAYKNLRTPLAGVLATGSSVWVWSGRSNAVEKECNRLMLGTTVS